MSRASKGLVAAAPCSCESFKRSRRRLRSPTNGVGPGCATKKCLSDVTEMSAKRSAHIDGRLMRLRSSICRFVINRKRPYNVSLITEPLEFPAFLKPVSRTGHRFRKLLHFQRDSPFRLPLGDFFDIAGAVFALHVDARPNHIGSPCLKCCGRYARHDALVANFTNSAKIENSFSKHGRRRFMNLFPGKRRGFHHRITNWQGIGQSSFAASLLVATYVPLILQSGSISARFSRKAAYGSVTIL